MADGKPRSKTKTYLIAGAITLFCLIFLVIIPTIIIVVNSRHTIKEGNVGVYFVNEALQDSVHAHGTHWVTPFVTEVKEITIRPIATTMKDMRTVTKDGILSLFKGVQVISAVNRQNLIPLIRKFGTEFREELVFDNISWELRLFCGDHTIDEVYNTLFMNMTPTVKENVESRINHLIGNETIKVLNLVIPKPDIPRDILQNYKMVKIHSMTQLVEAQKRKTEKAEKRNRKYQSCVRCRTTEKSVGD